MFVEKLDSLERKLDKILEIHSSIPNWYPITKEFAKERGYKTLDGLRNWCLNNLHPDDFVKRGRFWYISIRSLPYLPKKQT